MEGNGPPLGAFPDGLPPEREAARQQWLSSRMQAFIARLLETVAAQPAAQATAPPPSDLNQWIDAMSGRTQPPPGLGASMSSGPQDALLQGMSPVNQGPPPGPTQAGPEPPLPPPGPLGYGVNEPVDAGWQGGLPALGGGQDTPAGMNPGDLPGGRITVGSGPNDVPHPPATMDFIRSLLEQRPELMRMQSPSNPTRTQDAQMLAVAIELMNEGLDTPVESSGPAGAGGLRSFMEGQGRTPAHIQNAVGQKAQAASRFMQGLPGGVRGMMSPDAPQQIAENPGGKLTNWAQELLGQRAGQNDLGYAGSPLDVIDPAPTQQLRTNQADALLKAGPGRSSLLAGLQGPEAALAQQAGGIVPFVTGMGGMGRNPEAAGAAALDQISPGLSGMMDPIEGLPNPQGPGPVGRSGMTSGQIGGANSDAMAALLGRIPDDTGQLPGGSGYERPPSMGTDWLAELRKVVGDQARGRSSSDWAPDQVAPNRLENAVNAEVDLPRGEQFFTGPDMLEGNPSRSVGLDAPGNIRVGGPAGQVLSGSLLEKIMGSAKGAIKGAGGAALNVLPNALDLYSANEFAQALRGANEQYGGVMTPDSQGNMSPIPVDPNWATAWSMVPFFGLDRRRFQSDPAYRREMIGAPNIPEAA